MLAGRIVGDVGFDGDDHAEHQPGLVAEVCFHHCESSTRCVDERELELIDNLEMADSVSLGWEEEIEVVNQQ